jgi:hypothetical protein
MSMARITERKSEKLENMSKLDKKLIRQRFRDTVFERDDYVCLLCPLDTPQDLDDL